MLRLASTTAILAALCMPAVAQGAMSSARMQSAVTANSVTVTNWYKQSVYDPSDNKIGEIMDVLVDKAGQITSLIVGVGGFLGAGEKDVAVPFDAVHVTTKNNNKWYLIMNATKDSLKSAPGFTYNKDTTTWVPEKK
jgi:sporulation protein YlmC with PRC-barrel domain